MSTQHTLIDRGFDRKRHRYVVVTGIGTLAKGDTVQTDRGMFAVVKVGRPYLRGSEPVCNAYVNADAATLGDPTDRLTPEQSQYRAERARRQRAGFDAYMASTTPAERRAAGRAAWEDYRKSTTYGKRAARTREGIAEYWRIMRADPSELTHAELERQRHGKEARARKAASPAVRAKISAGTKRGKAKAKAQTLRNRDTVVIPPPRDEGLHVKHDAARGEWYVLTAAPLNAIRGTYNNEAAALLHVMTGAAHGVQGTKP